MLQRFRAWLLAPVLARLEFERVQLAAVAEALEGTYRRLRLWETRQHLGKPKEAPNVARLEVKNGSDPLDDLIRARKGF